MKFSAAPQALRVATRMKPAPVSAFAGHERLIALGLLLGTWLLFARAIPHPFVNYDDPDYVTANAHVRAGLAWESVKWAFGSADVSYWHPLTWLSHMLDWQLFGDNAHGHHATSVAWHGVNAALAFLVLRRLTGAVGLSALAAAVFAWHPLRVESVAWISERKDVLSGFFWLLTLWAYAGYVEARRARSEGGGRSHAAAAKVGVARTVWWRYAATLAAFTAGLASKPMLVTLPVVLLIVDFWPLGRLGRERWGVLIAEKIPFFILSAIVSRITVVAQTNVGTLSDVLPLDARLANAAVAVARYLGKFFAPANLAVLYPHPGYWLGLAVAAAAGLIAVIFAVAWWQRRARPWVLAGWLLFLFALLPASGVVQVGIQAMADRYTYVPMFGVTLAVLWTLRGYIAGPRAQRLAVIVLLALAVRTWHQLDAWRDSLTLFHRTLAVTENNYLAHNNRGLALATAGRTEAALADYRAALAILPTHAESNNNLGHLLAQLGRPAEALPYYRAALAAQPTQLEAHNNLGNALSDLGQLDAAIAAYRHVLERDPRHLNARNGYGVALAMQGDLAAATTEFEAVLRLDPANVGAHSNLGNIRAMTGRREEARDHYQRALTTQPDDARTLFNLGMVQRELGQLAPAAENLRRAVALAPVNPDAHTALGTVLAQLGRRDEALRHLQLALQQRPGYAPAQAALQALTVSPR